MQHRLASILSVCVCVCRGLYLALLLYSTEDRVLVTVDDNLPIVEVGDEYNRSTLGTDISWLNKVGGAEWMGWMGEGNFQLC